MGKMGGRDAPQEREKAGTLLIDLDVVGGLVCLFDLKKPD
jgi:hypothetical protein